uniref:Uncharacterized protein n=1 Tax=Ditylenchus dipsaci TaxID=166011 RepID=A0A915E109_9BILA
MAMNGSVGMFDSHNFHHPLLFASKVHSSFVTSVEFLPQQASHAKEWSQKLSNSQENGLEPADSFIPGVCATSLASVISLSVKRLSELANEVLQKLRLLKIWSFTLTETE